MKSILLIFLSTLLGFSSGHVCQKLVPPTAATAEMFPYHAVVRTNLHAPNKSQQIWCNGALISHNFVLVRGTCVVGQNASIIYLGFSRNPFFSENREADLNGQTFNGEKMYMHEHFGYLQNPENTIINNLALVKLDRNIVLSETVKPIAIASPDDYPIPPGTFMNQTGFKSTQSNEELRYATVEENYIEFCNMFYGNSLLAVQEKCVKQRRRRRNTWAGPYVVNGILIGIQRSLLTNTTCHVNSPPCNINDVYISLEPALAWIYKISGIAGLSGKKDFLNCNPYWNIKATQSSTISQCILPPIDNHQPTKPTGSFEVANLDSDFSSGIRDAIRKGIKGVLCKKQ